MGIKNLCTWKKLFRKCRAYELNEINKELNIIKQCINKMNQYRTNIDICINNNMLSKVLLFKDEYIYESDIVDVFDLELDFNYSCGLISNTCEENIESRSRCLKGKQIELYKQIENYNKDLSLIKNIKSFYDELNESSNKTKDYEYFKFSRDRENNLIAIYFNIDYFIETRVATVYMLTSEGEHWRDKGVVLHLIYEKYPSHNPDYIKRDRNSSWVKIGDFISKDKMKGHGTFVLNSLEDIIKEVNKRIMYKNSMETDSYNHMNKIVGINGMVCPGDIPYDILVKFYNKNGYETFDDDRYLYKEIK
ncbi:hypothetical protein [Paraclostridium sordellii]|uniref:hypothetical protein n=2 Tax=Paraclostridium sordellii TaxID=1505 RepID=UPI0022E57A14|nr:hypothetical protein [Paeniclostridium sordellii]